MPTRPRSLRPTDLLVFLLFVLYPSTGCGQARDLFLWQLGCIAFVTYLVTVAVTVGISKLHERPWFSRWVDKHRGGVAYVAYIVMAAGAAILALGLTWLTEPWGPDKLLFLEGSLVLTTGLSLLGWARATNPPRRLLYAKLVTVSVGFAIAVGYVMMGASMIG